MELYFFDEKYNTLAVEEIFFRCVADNTADTLIKQGFIDCGTNEELFLAIAALRDDTDMYQWLTDGDNYFYLGDGDCYIPFKSVPKLHKATVQELIEHFNK